MSPPERHARRIDRLLGLAVTILVCCGLLCLNACGCGRECPVFPVPITVAAK